MAVQSVSRAAVFAFSVTLALAIPAHAAEKLLIDGSTGVTPLVAALAKAYREHNPGTAIEIGKGLGTKARIEALSAGKIDIAMASHGLKVDDIKRQGMAVHEIGKVAVVFGVNASVSASNLTDDQICAIYSVKSRNWKELGASDLPIVPFTRPDSEVDAIVARENIGCLKNLPMPEAVKVAPKSGEMAKELASTAGAVGMTTMTVVEQSGGRIKPVSLRGIAPVAANVQNKTYVLTRDSFLVTKAAPSPAVAGFLDFIRSAAGEKVILANGAVPVK
jgi:phosphate transport system substrate-binding protein